jgi:DNA-binding response OmpR family regulator
MATKQLVIVDDSVELREAVALYAKAEGWRVLTSNGDNVPELQDNQPTLVLLDYLLGGAGPERWLEEFRKKYPNPGAILRAGQDETFENLW